MNDIVLINKLRYLQFGKQAPKNSRFKGIISTDSVVGLLNYHSSKNKKNNTNQQNLLNYSQKISQNETFTNLGFLDTEKKKAEFKEEVAQHFQKEGDTIWETIVSFKDYDTAKKYGLIYAKDYAALISKALSKFFILNKLSVNNMIFWIDHHNDTDNPHCHIGFLEKEKTLTTAYFSKNKLDQLKKCIANEISLRKEFFDENKFSHVELLKEKDIQKQNVKNKAIDIIHKNEKEIGLKIKTLYSKLEKTGRLSYNSIHQKENREELDSIVKLILESNDEIKEEYTTFSNTLKKLDSFQNKKLNSNINRMQQSEIKKLHIQIANYILREFKNYSQLHPMKEKKQVLDIISSSVSKEKDNIEAISYAKTNTKIYFTDKDLVNDETQDIKQFQIINTKNYAIVKEGIPDVVSGLELFLEAEKQFHQESIQQKQAKNEVVIHNNQFVNQKEKAQVYLKEKKIKFQLEPTEVKKINPHFSIVNIKEQEKYLVYTNNKFCYLKGEQLIPIIEENTMQQRMKNQIIKKEKPKLHLNTAKKIVRNSRSLGMGWMNKVKQETEYAIYEYLTNYSKDK